MDKEPDELIEIDNSPLKAIKRHCYECSGYNRNEANNCELVECPLWPFRFGKRPKTVLGKRGSLVGKKHLEGLTVEE